MKIGRAVMALALCAPLHGLRAQRRANAQSEPRVVEPVRARIIVADSTAASECAVILRREPYAVRPIASECRVVDLEPLQNLDDSGGRSWTYALYRHRSIYQFSDSANTARDTVTELEMVLFAADPARPHALRAELHARQEEAIVRSITPSVATHARSAVVSVTLCFNGTGGCWQEFLRERGATWLLLPDPGDAVRESVLRWPRAGRSWSMHAPNIDVRSLHGTAAIYARDDANCCPSRRADFDLALEDDHFRVVRFVVRANP